MPGLVLLPGIESVITNLNARFQMPKLERFPGLNICSFSRMKFVTGILLQYLASSVSYLTIAMYSWEDFHITLKNHKNHKSLAQWIFPRLQYTI